MFAQACHFLAICLGALVLFPGHAGADGTLSASVLGLEKVIPGSQAEVQLSYAPIVKASTPSVVNVYASRVVRQSAYRSPLFDDPFFRRFFGDQLPQRQRERIKSSLGSGVIVSDDGVIVTNNHVIKGAEKLTVALSDRREFEAEIMLTDERTDLAVLRIDTGDEKLPALTFDDSDTAEVGDIVLAIGNPFGVGQTVTSGIVSALARTRVGVSDYQFFIQTDAAINPGNSGGALVGLNGKLMGINTAIYSRSGGSNGIGFAIPANMVRLVVDQAISGGELVRPWFGATGQTVTSELAASLDLDRPRGLLLTSVRPDSPAGRAGLQSGDLILSIDGFEISDTQALRYRVAIQKVGAKIPVSYMRKGRERMVSVKLVAPPEDPPRNETVLDGAQPLAGAKVINLSPAANDQLGLDPMSTGVMVTGVDRRSWARRYGLGPGDIIRTVNGRSVATVNSLEKELEAAQGRWTISIERDGRLVEIDVKG